MSLLAIPIVSVLSLTLSLLCIIIIIITSTRHKVSVGVARSQSQANELLIANLQSTYEQLQSNIKSLIINHEQATLENSQISKQLEHRIKTLQTHVSAQQSIIDQLQTEQGEDKFYTRAIKLAKKGAALDEIVNECELPRAEVEMLLSVYQVTTRS